MLSWPAQSATGQYTVQTAIFLYAFAYVWSKSSYDRVLLYDRRAKSSLTWCRQWVEVSKERENVKEIVQYTLRL